MKKLALFCIAGLLSGNSIATSNYTGSNGILVIPDVNVNGTTFYESVTLQFDWSNNTFTVLNAKLKNTKISDTPLDTLTTQGYDIGFLGCASTGTNEITCYLRVVNNQADRQFAVWRTGILNGEGNDTYYSLIYDDLNNRYEATSITFTNESLTDSGGIYETLIQGVPARISMIFKGIDIRAKSISAFKPAFADDKSFFFKGNFKNIKF